LEALDALVRKACDTWHAPGLAVAVVKGDEVVYLKGVGVREQGQSEPVTPETIFPIGSLTKAVTATALAQLIDDGKAGWDDPVRKHLSWFRLADPLADRDVTLRDLLCHRTGLGRNDLIWLHAPWSIEENVRRLAFLEPAHSFRSVYEYNNITYHAAGLVLESITKEPWQDLVRHRLLAPLKINHAVFTSTEARKAADHASPHHRKGDGKVEVIDWYNDDKQIRASGSLKMSVRDLGQWLRFQVAGGRFEGRQLVSARNFKETHTAQVVVPLDEDLARMTGASQDCYGLGWHLTDYRGHPLHEHGGSVQGFRAHIYVLPRDELGVAVLTNMDDAGMLVAAGSLLLDHLLGLEKKDWHAFYLGRSREAARKRQQEHRKLLASRHPDTRPSRELEAYAGSYHEPAYGTVRIEREGRKLVLRWSGYRVTLEHFHFDTFLPELKEERHSLYDKPAVFELDADGKVAVLHFLGRKLLRQME
jgi:CubicO group peptidase (beta-lactamase class C family)